MKLSKTFSIDDNLLEKVNSEANPSALVNFLLEKYYTDKSFASEGIEEKIKSLESLESEIIKVREAERLKAEADLKNAYDVKKRLDEEQAKQINENVSLIESNAQLTSELLTFFAKRKESGEPLEFNQGNKPVYEFIFNMVEKYREAGLRVGIFNIKAYLKLKGYFV